TRRLTLGLAAGIIAILALATAAVSFDLRKGHGAEAAPIRGNAVAIVDARTARLIGSVPVDSRPAAIASGAGSIWVASADDRSVARISPASRRVVASVVLAQPAQGLAASAKGVWAVGSGPTDAFLTLDRIDPTFNTAARVRRLPTVVIGDGGSVAPARSARGVPP